MVLTEEFAADKTPLLSEDPLPPVADDEDAGEVEVEGVAAGVELEPLLASSFFLFFSA